MKIRVCCEPVHRLVGLFYEMVSRISVPSRTMQCWPPSVGWDIFLSPISLVPHLLFRGISLVTQ